MKAVTLRIEHGIEHFVIVDERGYEVPGEQCARCGSSAEWESCEGCGGDGLSRHDCGEDSCWCADDAANVTCGECGGRGGRWHCLSSRDWCESNPLPDRENVRSTAMPTEAWRDAL